MKKLFFWLVAFGLLFYWCSDDDDDSGSVSESSSANIHSPRVNPQVDFYSFQDALNYLTSHRFVNENGILLTMNNGRVEQMMGEKQGHFDLHLQAEGLNSYGGGNFTITNNKELEGILYYTIEGERHMSRFDVYVASANHNIIIFDSNTKVIFYEQ